MKTYRQIILLLMGTLTGLLLVVLGLPVYVAMCLAFLYACVGVPLAVLALLFEGTAVGLYVDKLDTFVKEVLEKPAYYARIMGDFFYPFENVGLNICLGTFLFIIGVFVLVGVFGSVRRGALVRPPS